MNRRAFLAGMTAAPVLAAHRVDVPAEFPHTRKDYLEEPDSIPDFWVSSPPGVNRFLDHHIHRGRVMTIGLTAGGRPMRCVFYGSARKGKGTTTFSGSLGFGNVRAYLGSDHAKKVYMAMGSVHGGEFEGIVGIMNLLSVLETGKDLTGRSWPEITEAAGQLDRIILLPITNVDGRTRVPLRMMKHRGSDYTVPEYLNTGGKLDGTLIGWPQCKEFIPMDFSQVAFPGGYPNDAGVNIQHDDFLGSPQPETRALLGLTARERPDLILNLHTGTQFISPMRPCAEPALMPVFDGLFRTVRTRLTREQLQATDDPKREADPSRLKPSSPNIDSALNLNCGALSVTVESPSHAYSTGKRHGKPFPYTPDMIVRAHLFTHLEAMKYLAATGGRIRWAPGRNG